MRHQQNQTFEAPQSSSLLGISDGPVAVDMTHAEFEKRLVHAFLFEPTVVVVDAYFFASEHLKKHIFESNGGNASLFEVALRENFIYPALRQPARDFNEVLAYLRTQQSLRGYYDEMDPLADRLCAAYKGSLDKFVYSESSGERYERLIKTAFQRQDVPTLRSEKLWLLTEELRYEAVKTSKKLTRAMPNGRGLRRGELLRAAGQILGVIDKHDDSTTDYKKVLAAYEKLHARNTAEYRAAASFFDWINEIHRINFAQLLKTRASVFSRQVDDLVIISPLLGKSDDADNEGSRVVDTLSMTVKVPSTSRLLHVDPKRLLELKQQFGLDWEAKGRRFLEEPNDSTRHLAEEALETYARKLRRKMPTPSFNDLSVKVFATKDAPVLWTAAASLMPHEYGTYAASATATGYLFYRYVLKGKHEKARITLQASVDTFSDSGRFSLA